MRAGEVILALDRTFAQGSSDGVSQANVTNTSFVPATPEVSVTFVAPSSGVVWMVSGGGIADSTNDYRGVIAFEIRFDNVAGNIVTLPSLTGHSWTSSSNTGFLQYGSRMVPIINLTPGQTYFARVMIMVNSEAPNHTVDFFNKQLFAVPG